MQHPRLRLCAFITLAVSLTSCQTHKALNQEPSMVSQAMADVQAQQAQAKPEISSQEVLDSLLPPMAAPETAMVEERFDVSVKNIDARSFLLGLVDDTPYNMVVSPELEMQITLQLKNVSVSEVLGAVERIYPIMVERKGNMFFVSSAESMSAVYQVDYINLQRKGVSRTSIAGQTLAAGGGDNNQGNSNNRNNQGNNSGSGNNVTLLNSSEITTETDTNFWRELSQSLNLIIQGEEKANVVVSPHAGIVVVKALPRTQQLIEEYLGVTQNSLERQVILEAKIIEVTLADAYQAGIDWSKMNSVDGSPLTFGQQGQIIQTQDTESPLNGIFSMIYQGSSFQAAIDLLQSQGDVQVLSSPRVSTVNNQKAVIKVGNDEFFVTDVSTTTVTGTSTATTPDVTLTPFFSGISLDVTPQINKKGEIVLHIHPVVSDVEDQKKTLTLGQDEFTLPLAVTNIRESDSIVRTMDRQVVVIGGLMQEQLKSTVNSVPVLGDIPVLGELFSQTREAVTKKELVILLRANLVNDKFNRDQLEQIRQRFDLMD